MKKFKKLIISVFAFVLCFSCIFSLCACDVAEIKENTAAAVESATNVLPVEYSKELSANILQAALAETNLSSYKVEIEINDFINGSFIDATKKSNATVIQYENLTEYFAGSVDYWIKNSNDIKYYEEFTAVKKLKDNDGNSQYYLIKSYKTEGENPSYLKTYVEGTPMGTADMSALLPYVTGGMCLNGISYINCFASFKWSEDDIGGEYYQVKIKDGKIINILQTRRNKSYTTMSTYELTYTYENVEKLDFPDTISELEELGYVYGQAYDIINNM